MRCGKRKNPKTIALPPTQTQKPKHLVVLDSEEEARWAYATVRSRAFPSSLDEKTSPDRNHAGGDCKEV